MIIEWKFHARQRFWERIACLDIDKTEAELEIKKQLVRFVQPETNTIKTIFEIRGRILTVIKNETKSSIKVVSVWEASLEEVKIWTQKQGNACAAELQH
ncbi:hypothetical protein KKE06_02605 [Candidatus Micrarchaeota archaeon]|nr:hypothetical protein [Candidatus Micrarchaeota archaeon]MBU1930427.1 hypothetical protein [Candidatus Micrarchaeota archaeon]